VAGSTRRQYFASALSVRLGFAEVGAGFAANEGEIARITLTATTHILFAMSFLLDGNAGSSLGKV
jgi:hypothetical protein